MRNKLCLPFVLSAPSRIITSFYVTILKIDMTNSSPKWEAARCFGFILLSVIILPLSTSIVCLLCMRRILSNHNPEETPRNSSYAKSPKRTVLVTGVGMAKGLALARSFYLSGHRVIGADFERAGIPCPGRYSRSLSAFYRLPEQDAKDNAKAYTKRLIDIIQIEVLDLWVSCSGVASAVEDAHAKELVERHTSCKCIQFDVEKTSILHDKGSFMEECKKLSLSVPETHEVKSKRDILRILSASTTSTAERKFILKPIGVDDANRGNMTRLPLASKVETNKYVSQLPISEQNPWILQQFIPGNEEYCTHALIIQGEVKCFVACPSAELLMHYRPLSQDSHLWQSMLAFTVEFVKRSSKFNPMTGHLSFDFMASDRKSDHNQFKDIYAIECNPRAHTAVVLFGQQNPEIEAMVQAYLTAVGINSKETETDLIDGIGAPFSTVHTPVTPAADSKPRYWIGHNIVALLIHPILLWGIGSINFRSMLSSLLEFVSHLFSWKEGTFEVWDPLPAMVLYHVYWPMTILSAWWHGKHWSRVNVSTTKMFMC
ncbi:uncharacterized protein F4822DRAFT_416863 [Hypoxylon trugodes]|uniref:uncharacterized protein n=1 Tax=Hypoxylon trugodes TaxID=326681 RepID=UPI002197B9CE|nr:uncharacterized protein F4822DRAFT_416863 [Hypoxylon trugodes]KAI1384967.1 hypothetical protein F4822DRAFT_416863 [Hypoxylon trugodes]